MFSINRPNCSYSCFLEVTIWSSIWQNVDRHKNCWCKYGYQGKFWEKASFNIHLKTANFINKADAEVRFTLMKLNSVFQSTFEQFGADTYSSIRKVMSSAVSSQSFKQSLTENESLTYIVWATLIETSLSLSWQTLSELIVRTSWITIKNYSWVSSSVLLFPGYYMKNKWCSIFLGSVNQKCLYHVFCFIE